MDFFRRENRVRVIKNKLRVDADYWQHPRWQLVTLLEQLSGFWPYQGLLQQYTLRTFHCIIFSSIFLAVANKTREFAVMADTEMIIEGFLIMMFLLVLIIKFFLACTLQRRRQRIYERISEHFKVINDPVEAAVLAKHADRGFKYTVIYMCIACIAVGIYDSVPIARSLYKYFFLHGELNVQLPLQMDYGFDHRKYWYVIVLDFSMFVCCGTIIDGAFDLSFILQIRHVQALFKVVEVRLKKASEVAVAECEGESTSDDAAENSYSMISKAIDLHSQCLELVQLIEETYTVNWFLILLINTGCFASTTHLTILRWHDSLETLRNFVVYVLFLLHFYVIFSQGQRVIDSSSMVSYASR